MINEIKFEIPFVTLISIIRFEKFAGMDASMCLYVCLDGLLTKVLTYVLQVLTEVHI